MPANIWRIYHIKNCPFTNPIKDKFILIVCFDGNPFGFLINSKIHPFIQRRPALLSCQISIKSSDYWFLDHDSYIDCSRLFECDEVLLNSGREIVSSEIQGAVKQAVLNSTLIEKYYQDLILSQ